MNVRKNCSIIIIVCILATGLISLVSEMFRLPIGQVMPVSASLPDSSLNLMPIDTSGATLFNIRIINIYPHDPDAYTQGLVFHKGYIYEGTGLYGHSSIRKVNLNTGKVLKSNPLPHEYFGEGITICRNRLIQLTWQSHIGFIYDLQSFRLLGSFPYPTEGWGITFDGNHLIMSDGTAILRFLDPESFKLMRQVEVKTRGHSVSNINELEYIKGEIYANIWSTGYIARISPKTGKVTGWIDLRALYQYAERSGKVDVLNGIAYDAEKDRLFVTGKYWPYIFEIRLETSK